MQLNLFAQLYIWIVSIVHSKTVTYYTQCIRERPITKRHHCDGDHLPHEKDEDSSSTTGSEFEQGIVEKKAI
jgi:hypothetical protein